MQVHTISASIQSDDKFERIERVCCPTVVRLSSLMRFKSAIDRSVKQRETVLMFKQNSQAFGKAFLFFYCRTFQ